MNVRAPLHSKRNLHYIFRPLGSPDVGRLSLTVTKLRVVSKRAATCSYNSKVCGPSTEESPELYLGPAALSLLLLASEPRLTRSFLFIGNKKHALSTVHDRTISAGRFVLIPLLLRQSARHAFDGPMERQKDGKRLEE